MQYKQYENPEQILQERKKLVTDIVRGRDGAKRIPVAAQTRAWPIFDAGYKLTEALTNYDILEEVVCRFHETYEFDLYVDLFTRFAYNVTQALGGGGLIVDDEKQAIYYHDEALIVPEEYDEIIKNGILKEYYENVFPRKYNFYSKEDAIKKIGEALRENYKLRKFNDKVLDIFKNCYGVPRGTNDSPVKVKMPIDDFLDGSGMKNFATTLRRFSPSYVLKLLDVIDDKRTDANIKDLDNYSESDNDVFSLALTSTTNSFLSTKQFEKFSLPYFKQYTDAIVRNNQIACLFFEGSMKHILDFFQDLPAGHFMLVVETDDIKELKVKLPNMTFCGGYPTYYLGHNTKQECVDKAKEVIDEIGRDKKLVFTTDKMMAYPSDGKGENLLAVVQTVKEYGKF